MSQPRGTDQVAMVDDNPRTAGTTKERHNPVAMVDDNPRTARTTKGRHNHKQIGLEVLV